MHFRITGAFTFVFAFLSILSIASPLSPQARTNVAVNGIDVRQINVVIDAIVDIVEEVVENIITDIFAFNSNAHAVERNFTQQTIESLLRQYPTKNALVFHNQHSHYDLFNYFYVHHEVDVGLGFTQGYEIYVFDFGTFSLAGDGGYENYAIGRCYAGPSIALVFTQPDDNGMCSSPSHLDPPPLA